MGWAPSARLVDRTGLPTVNEIVVSQAAIMAYKAMRIDGHPLEGILEAPRDARTRAASHDLRQPASTRCQAAVDMSAAWNTSKELLDFTFCLALLLS